MRKNYGFTKIENTIGKIVKPALKKKKYNFVVIENLTKNWSNIIGNKYYKFCEAEKVKFDKNKKNNATLYIKAYNPSIAFFIETNSNHIIEKIASYYGYKIISKIKINQELRNIDLETDNKPKIKIDKEKEELIHQSTTQIKDKELQSTLSKLGKALFSGD